MNWLNLSVQTLDSEHFIGAEPTDRATWLCLMRYCIGQENGGVIEECGGWADRKWQQLVRVTKEEVMRECALWDWDNGSLVVWAYPNEKEDEVKALRENGRKGGKSASESKTQAARENGTKGGRPAKPKRNPSQNPTERNRKEENRIEEKGILSAEEKPLCTLEQAKSYAGMVKMNEDEADHWWHTRNSAGWTKGSAGGGAGRRITSWQSDMASSVSWVREGMKKNGKSGFDWKREGITLE